MSRSIRTALQAAGALVAFAGLYVALTLSWGGLPPLERFVDPADGFWHTARTAELNAAPQTLQLTALNEPVTVVRDERGVPHIYAQSDRDVTIAMGYVVARDRLFQMDFTSRVAQGRLSELLGPSMANSDRFLRATGMEWGAQANIRRIEEEGGTEWDALRWYTEGANAHIEALSPREWPLEYRLLNAEPTLRAPIDGPRLLQFMTYDLTYRSDAPVYHALQQKLSPEDYATLYPDHPSGLYAPMFPEGAAEASHHETLQHEPLQPASIAPSNPVQAILEAHHAAHHQLQDTALEGYRFGKGSNNWAVAPSRSSTGGALLANDMHLGVSVPSIWYEVHLHTPTTDVSGLTIPGAPVIVQGVNDHVGWALTNAGADVIDHYVLTVNDDRTQYRYDETWHDLELQVDTLYMQGATPVLDTLRISRWGPLLPDTPQSVADTQAVALQWVAHHPNRTLHALWQMNRATSVAALDSALADWHAPMQNIAMADTKGNIGMRMSGALPMRASGTGKSILDGSTDAHAWTGWVPHDEMPHVHNPERGVLGSANQVPVGPSYPHYAGHDWRDGYRSVRLDTLLDAREQHSLNDMKAYQVDVYVQEREAFAPFIEAVEPARLTEQGVAVRGWLLRWNGHATTDRHEPLVMHTFLQVLRDMMWDEPVFSEARRPQDAVLLNLLEHDPEAPWFNRVDTDTTETGLELIGLALDATADTLAARYTWDPEAWRWGDHHQLEIAHLLPAGPFASLGRGPYPFPGFASTLLQAPGLRVSHTASQRAVVDFSGDRPEAHVVYPGGQRAHPFDPVHFDLFVGPYLEEGYYVQARPQDPGEIKPNRISEQVQLMP
ncbi:MAG: penicillin acylase family protein [Longimonas sp.]|uniref:penicillin acylase family protein n=1 Tax=Longimonas sp. TaxID=2039626 RepID=UPI00334FB1F7